MKRTVKGQTIGDVGLHQGGDRGQRRQGGAGRAVQGELCRQQEATVSEGVVGGARGRGTRVGTAQVRPAGLVR